MAQPKQRPDFQKYQYGALAEHLISSKESGRYAPGALEVLAGAKGLGLGPEALGFIRGTQASEKGIKTAAEVYAGEFEEKRGEYKPSELATSFYAPVLSQADKEDRETILAKLGLYNETLGSIHAKYAEAAYTLQAPKTSKKVTAKDRAEAEATFKKYHPIIELIEALDRYTFENLRPEAVNATLKQELKGLASKV